MRRTAAALFLALAFAGACNQSDDPTTVDTDTQTEGNRETGPCLHEDDQTRDTIEPDGESPMGATEDQQNCTDGNDGDTGDVESGGAPGVGTP